MSMKYNVVRPEKCIAPKSPKTSRKRDRRISGRPSDGQPVANIGRTDHTLDLDSLALPTGDPALLYLQTLAPGSRASQWSAIRRVALSLSDGEVTDGVYPWETLTAEDVARLRCHLIETVAPPTGRRYLSVLKAMVEFTYVTGRITADKHAVLVHRRNLLPIRGSSPPAGRALDRSEAARFIRSCASDRSSSAARDAAMFGILYCSGIRGRELINLDLADIDLDTGQMTVTGKGRKNRNLVLSTTAVEVMRWWLKVRGPRGGPLFVPLAKGGAVAGIRRMSYQALAASLRRRAELAGLESFSPHDLRRTFVTDLLKGGENIEVVAHLCGHASVDTTARYSRHTAAAGEQISKFRDLPNPWKSEGDGR